ncbi:MAG TPA: TRAP transporter small permease [Xanthobacteraceae bacterium]|jgi:TRAP-type C4-dicarboxylate transport system permease small subunit
MYPLSIRNLVTFGRGLAAVIQGFATVLLLIAVSINFANIVGRYVFGAPIFWAEEVMLFLLIGIVFIGNCVVGWEGRQLHMDVVLHMLPVKLRRCLELLGDLAVIAVSLVVAVVSWPAVEMLAEFDQRSEAANLPLLIPHMLLPIGLVLISMLVAIRVISRIVNDRERINPQSNSRAP